MSSRAARVHFDPHVDIDWDAPWQFEMFALPPTSVSLYGTRRWRKLTPEQQLTTGVTPGLVRLSVGLENIDDLIADLELGFAAARKVSAAAISA